MENKELKNKEATSIIDLLAMVAVWFISAAFIWLGWNVLAPHLNAPEFTYWEIFLIRMGVKFTMITL